MLFCCCVIMTISSVFKSFMMSFVILEWLCKDLLLCYYGY